MRENETKSKAYEKLMTQRTRYCLSFRMCIWLDFFDVPIEDDNSSFSCSDGKLGAGAESGLFHHLDDVVSNHVSGDV